MIMATTTSAGIIRDNPIGNGLDWFCSSYASLCRDRCVAWSLDVVDQLSRQDIQALTFDLLLALQSLSAPRLLPSATSAKSLVVDLTRLSLAVNSDDFDLAQTKPLLLAALSGDDSLIWSRAYSAVVEPTPPARPLPSLSRQTPRSRNTDSLVNSHEVRRHIDFVLKTELNCLYANIPNFFDAFFGSVPRLGVLSDAVFRRCAQDDLRLFGPQGWTTWPPGAKERDVLTWLGDLIPRLEAFIPDGNYTSRRKLFTQPQTPLHGSRRRRALDVGFVKSDRHGLGDWSHILAPGELKSNPADDVASEAWLDLARYAREVFAAQDTRRFVLGFTLCGSILRLWNFDRLGGIASEKFDINTHDGARQLVTMILGFLCLDEDRLGFDASVITSPGGQRHIEINRDGQKERLVIDGVMRHSSCIVGRATTCWKAHREGDEAALVIKSSWQYMDRDEEGLLLQEAAAKRVVGVARYYHHEAVLAYGAVDQIRDNIRKGLDLTRATTHRLNDAWEPQDGLESSSVQNIKAGSKRPSNESHASDAPSKRLYSVPLVKAARAPPDRIHRRVIVQDYGEPIYKASNRVALLAALSGCIRGHESLLHEAGILHRDISINNLIINEDDQDLSQRAFLIDLDLAIREKRKDASGAEDMTGTRAFMAIGALLGDQHSFMHDLESFFWVLFWLCIHYMEPDKPARVVSWFDKWNYDDAAGLAYLKLGLVSNEGQFLKCVGEYFTPYYAPLSPWVNRLRRILFPGDKAWRGGEDEKMYARVLRVLRDAQEDPNVLATNE